MPRGFLLLLVLILCLAGLAVGSFMIASREPGARSSGIGGPFRLTSANGGEVTDADFKGHPFLVYFGYTHCPDICPTVLSQMSQVLKAMGHDKRIKAVFITVDPERDTPAVMKEYLSSFDPNIIGLSGTRAETDAVEKAYRVYASKTPGNGSDYLIDHTALIFLMDKRGHFVTPVDLDLPRRSSSKSSARIFDTCQPNSAWHCPLLDQKRPFAKGPLSAIGRHFERYRMIRRSALC
jgi:protein SCO1/2